MSVEQISIWTLAAGEHRAVAGSGAGEVATSCEIWDARDVGGLCESCVPQLASAILRLRHDVLLRLEAEGVPLVCREGVAIGVACIDALPPAFAHRTSPARTEQSRGRGSLCWATSLPVLGCDARAVAVGPLSAPSSQSRHKVGARMSPSSARLDASLPLGQGSLAVRLGRLGA